MASAIFLLTATQWVSAVAPAASPNEPTRAELAKEMTELNRQSAAQAATNPATGYIAVEQRSRNWPIFVQAAAKSPLQIGTQNFTSGLVCEAPCKMVVHLPGPGKTFTAVAGIDTSGVVQRAMSAIYNGNGDVLFSVLVGDKVAFASTALNAQTAGASVHVDLGGSSEFVLNTAAGATPGLSCDWPAWAVGKVTLADGRELKLDAMPIRKAQSLGWKCADIVIEWGFDNVTKALTYDGRITSSYDLGKVGAARPLEGDAATVMTGVQSWRSTAKGGARRGIIVPVLYTDAVRGPERAIVTVRTNHGSFSFQPADLEDGPILAPEYGFFVAKANDKTTARAFRQALVAKGLKTNRQRVRELPEISWEQSVRAMFGNDVVLPEFPAVPYEPRMAVQVPDTYLTGLWRIGAWQIIRHCPKVKRSDIPKIIKNDAWMYDQGTTGFADAGIVPVDEKDPDGVYFVSDYPFAPLSAETDRILWILDQMGMHEVTKDGLSLWLDHPQTKGPDKGALMLDMFMDQDHAVGALHILWVIAEHYRLTGDQEWLRQQAPTLLAASDWIVRRRQTTLNISDTPEDHEMILRGERVHAGLQPAVGLGDGGRGARTAAFTDACAYQSLRELADVMADIDAPAAAKLTSAADQYQKDLAPVLEDSIVLSPVVKVGDGTYRSFVPQAFDDRGRLTWAMPETTNGFYSHDGPWANETIATSGAIESWLRSGMLSVQDPRLDGHFQVLEDLMLVDHPWLYMRKADYDPAKDWFLHAGWVYQSGWERVPEFYLAQDDVPNFLRSWLNHCAVDLMLDPKDPYTNRECVTWAAVDKSHGKAVFLSNFRNLLVMEDGKNLWLAKATPRAWLEQGKEISVKHAPTWFGEVGYDIVSDVEHGKIHATVEMPSRKLPQQVTLRFRHPKAAPIKSVLVNGKAWKDFNRDKETISLTGMTGTVSVTANY